MEKLGNSAANRARLEVSLTSARVSGTLALAVSYAASAVGCAAHDADAIDTQAASEDARDQGTRAAADEFAAQWVDDLSKPPEVACDEIQPSLDCGAPLAPGDERLCRVGSRSYTIRAGKTMDPCKPVALVVDLPASPETAAQQLGRETYCLGNLCWSGLGSGWAAESDTPEGGFVVLVPHRTSRLLGSREDPSAIRQLVEEAKRVAPIDPERVYISGLADGGDTAHETGCRHADVFRGISPNSGGVSCRGVARSVPTITFSATGSLTFASDLASTEGMARANGCKRGPNAWRTFDARTRDAVCRSDRGDPTAKLVPCSEVTSARIEPTRCRVWDQCNAGVEVVFCEVAPNTEHGPLNAAADALIVYSNATLLNTPSVAWRFFQQFHEAPESGAAEAPRAE